MLVTREQHLIAAVLESFLWALGKESKVSSSTSNENKTSVKYSLGLGKKVDSFVLPTFSLLGFIGQI